MLSSIRPGPDEIAKQKKNTMCGNHKVFRTRMLGGKSRVVRAVPQKIFIWPWRSRVAGRQEDQEEKNKEPKKTTGGWHNTGLLAPALAFFAGV